MDERSHPGRAAVIESELEGDAKAALGGVEVAVGESGEASTGDGFAADLGIVLPDGDAVRLGPVRPGGCVVAGGVRHGGAGQVDAAALPWRKIRAEALLGEAAADRELAAHPPVQPHVPGDAGRGRRIIGVERAFDGDEDVRLLFLDPFEPFDLVRALVPGGRLFDEAEMDASVGAPDASRTLADQQASGVLRNGFEQLKTVAANANERVLGELVQESKDVAGGELIAVLGHCLDRLQSGAATKRPEQREQALLIGIEQAVAPVEGGPHGALPFRQVACSRRPTG